jgi:hypothetical protein
LLNDRIIRNEGLDVINRSWGFKIKMRSPTCHVATCGWLGEDNHILSLTTFTTHLISLTLTCTITLPSLFLSFSSSLSVTTTAPYFFFFSLLFSFLSHFLSWFRTHTQPFPFHILYSSHHTLAQVEKHKDRERESSS